MQREQDFRHFFKSDLIQSLIYTEKERKGIVFRIIIAVVLPIVLIPIFLVLWRLNNAEAYLIPSIILLIGSPIYINKLFGDTQFYKNFKRKIIGKIIKYINPSLEYDNLQKVDDVEYDNSKFFDNTNTIIYGDDHVSGVINDVRVEFSELLAEYKSEADKKQFGNKYQFRGLFFLGEFRKNFGCEFVVKSSGLKLDNLTNNVAINSEFNKQFKIKIVSKQENISSILTSNVEKIFIELQSKIHNDFMVSFADNRVYLGIYHDEDLFEPTLFQTMNNYDKIKGYFDDLFYPLIFIENLTKELAIK